MYEACDTARIWLHEFRRVGPGAGFGRELESVVQAMVGDVYALPWCQPVNVISVTRLRNSVVVEMCIGGYFLAASYGWYILSISMLIERMAGFTKRYYYFSEHLSATFANGKNRGRHEGIM